MAVLSITACGTGLTLTAASTVVFAEMYWVLFFFFLIFFCLGGDFVFICDILQSVKKISERLKGISISSTRRWSSKYNLPGKLFYPLSV